jgi:hypothetical protein
MPTKSENLFIRACNTGKLELVKSLLDSGLSSETRDTYGLTGLIWAGRKGQIEVAKVLIDAGSDLDAKDRRGRTALFHAAAYKQYQFVEFLFERGANHGIVDAHNWTAFDVATLPRNDKMIEIFKRHGAARNATESTTPPNSKNWNSFGAGGADGGPDIPVEIHRIRIQLNSFFREWSGNYTRAIESFIFPMLVDGSVVRFTERMNILGAQKAKRKRNWVEVQIGVPKSWWREPEASYKKRLTDCIEEGLHSVIALLRRNKHEINAELLLADWESVKKVFLDTPAPPFAAEKQRALMMGAVQKAVRTVEELSASGASNKRQAGHRKMSAKK